MSFNLDYHQITVGIVDLEDVRLPSKTIYIPGRVLIMTVTKFLLYFNSSVNIDQEMQKIMGHGYHELVKANESS